MVAVDYYYYYCCNIKLEITSAHLLLNTLRNGFHVRASFDSVPLPLASGRYRRRLRYSIINRGMHEPNDPRLDESKLTAHYFVAFLFINAQRELSSMVL